MSGLVSGVAALVWLGVAFLFVLPRFFRAMLRTDATSGGHGPGAGPECYGFESWEDMADFDRGWLDMEWDDHVDTALAVGNA